MIDYDQIIAEMFKTTPFLQGLLEQLQQCTVTEEDCRAKLKARLQVYEGQIDDPELARALFRYLERMIFPKKPVLVLSYVIYSDGMLEMIGNSEDATVYWRRIGDYATSQKFENRLLGMVCYEYHQEDMEWND